jgi:hypothetical protein
MQEQHLISLHAVLYDMFIDMLHDTHLCSSYIIAALSSSAVGPQRMASSVPLSMTTSNDASANSGMCLQQQQQHRQFFSMLLCSGVETQAVCALSTAFLGARCAIRWLWFHCKRLSPAAALQL